MVPSPNPRRGSHFFVCVPFPFYDLCSLNNINDGSNTTILRYCRPNSVKYLKFYNLLNLWESTVIHPVCRTSTYYLAEQNRTSLNNTPKGVFDTSDNKSSEAIFEAVEAAEVTKRKRNTKKKINCLNWDLNPGPSDYQARLLTITPTGI